MEQRPASKRQEWKANWRLVLTAAVGFSFMSFMTPAAGIFMGPLSKEFGWSRTLLSIGISIAGIIGMLGSPLFGYLLDRLGARRLALPGLVLTMLATASFALTNGSVTQWTILWILWGFAALAIHSTTWSTAVAGAFQAGRGLALGLTLSGTALAQVIVPPLTNWLIMSQGWRAAYLYLAFGWGGVALILSSLFLFDARLKGARGDKEGISEKSLSELRAAMPGLSIRQAWRSSELWRVTIATFLILTVTIAILVHQFPILLEAGASRTKAAWLASLAGLAGIAGKLITGSLIDKYHARWVGGITLASTAIAYPLLLEGVGSSTLITIGIIISGYAAGTKIQLCGYLTARYAGMKNYGAVFGFMTSMIALASAIGPVAAGLSYDRFGSYTLLLVVGAIVSLISGALIFSLGAYPEWRDEPEY
ncbi:MFS transporter [Sphingobium yanoikuyae]|uniref:MFS transporter n=1 Tax=Sphingobium yanoikuyae TaxID=13690 RepID=UPI002FD9D197